MCFFSDGTDLLFKKASTAYEPIGSLARVTSSSSERVSKLLTNLLGSSKSNSVFNKRAPWKLMDLSFAAGGDASCKDKNLLLLTSILQ